MKIYDVKIGNAADPGVSLNLFGSMHVNRKATPFLKDKKIFLAQEHEQLFIVVDENGRKSYKNGGRGESIKYEMGNLSHVFKDFKLDISKSKTYRWLMDEEPKILDGKYCYRLHSPEPVMYVRKGGKK